MTDTDLIAWLRKSSVLTSHKAADRIEELTRSGYSDPPKVVTAGSYPDPPLNTVRVHVAVAVTPKHTTAWTALDHSVLAESLQNFDLCSHRCIAIVDVPAVAAFPEVPARVEEVKS